MRLKGTLMEVVALQEQQKQAMFALLKKYFDGVEKEKFLQDLSAKQWVILLADAVTGSLQGFSTQKLITTIVEGVPIKAIFSGDTIIDKDYWGENILAKIWLKHFTSLAAGLPETRVFWFLISMGYKTYRFMPVYFKLFYPCYNRITPLFEQKVMDILGCQEYPHDYNEGTGIIHFKQQLESLKPGVADIDQRRLKNPHIRYFAERNRNYLQGDELVCLAELRPENYQPAVLKILREKE